MLRMNSSSFAATIAYNDLSCVILLRSREGFFCYLPLHSCRRIFSLHNPYTADSSTLLSYNGRLSLQSYNGILDRPKISLDQEVCEGEKNGFCQQNDFFFVSEP
jgi:hypothetical protein